MEAVIEKIIRHEKNFWPSFLTSEKLVFAKKRKEKLFGLLFNPTDSIFSTTAAQNKVVKVVEKSLPPYFATFVEQQQKLIPIPTTRHEFAD